MLDKKQIIQEILSDSSPKIKISLTHIPTGIRVCGETDRFRTKLIEDLLIRLEEKIEKWPTDIK